MLTKGLNGYPGALVIPVVYKSMRQAMLRALPGEHPGLTWDELLLSLRPHLPGELFPTPRLVHWYAQTVKTDLEAERLLVSLPGRTERFWQIESV